MYRTEDDPWRIGAADSMRYEFYVNAIRSHARARGSVLDIGCGFGAMLARLQPDFERLHGIELSADAVITGAKRYPFITFEQGSIDALEHTNADADRFDAIICSDVIYYVDEDGKRASLRWIAEHLQPEGFAFIAAYCPGGKEYPTPAELRTLVEREFVIERHELLDSDHVMLLVRPRRRLAALTLDYETWQPVPAGRQIDWDADVFGPTDALLDACDAEGACLTIFAELGEHAFLRENEPELAVRMEAQWRNAVERGHDVQMHLHPNWLPELGARLEEGRYVWNQRLTRAEDHPDLVTVLGRLKQTLEEVIRVIDPTYEVVAFRAGGYEAQPFRRLAEALRANGMWCDSSVYRGGGWPGVYHDYGHTVDQHQPWFASHVDPQLEAPPAERGIVELPVATFGRNDRWTFDSNQGARFGDRLAAAIDAERTAGHSLEMTRMVAKARRLAHMGYHLMRGRRRVVNRFLPRLVADAFFDYPRQRLGEDAFYVAVGHSKFDLDVPAIREQIGVLREAGVEVVRLTEMANVAREQLEHFGTPNAESEGRRQVRREHSAALDPKRNEAQSHRLLAMIPLDRTRLLDLGCGAGTWSARIASRNPWLEVTGVDLDEELIAAARERHASGQMDFLVADCLSLPFTDGTFDCVYADNVLEHAVDIDATLAEARRSLADGGVLVAAIPPDAYDTRRMTDNHTWKTSAADVSERLRHAGFVDVSVEETDVYRLGAEPYPPALGRMLYIRAWRGDTPVGPVERIDELRHWTHRRLELSRGAAGSEPVELLHAGRANAAGMALVFAEALVREGYAPRSVSMVALDHPRGTGPQLEETHDVVELTLADRSVHVIDPVADVRFPHTLKALIDNSTLADGIDRERDSIYLEHDCDLYATSFWYQRVAAVAVRGHLNSRRHFVPAGWACHATRPRYQALAFCLRVALRATSRLRSILRG